MVAMLHSKIVVDVVKMYIQCGKKVGVHGKASSIGIKPVCAHNL